MNKILLIALAILMMAPRSFAQGYEWSEQIGGRNDAHAKYLVPVDDGSLICIGSFNDTIDVDPGPGTSLLERVGEGGLFIQKTNAHGDLVWAKQIGGMGGAYVLAVTQDQAGNLLLCGSFRDTVDFDPGPGVHELTGGNAGFILKLTLDGTFLWVIGSEAVGNDLETDNTGSIYVGGSFSGYRDFDPGPDTYYMNANHGVNGTADAFLLKLDPAGHFLWAKKWGSLFTDAVVNVKLDKNGNVITSGLYMGDTDFDPGSGNVTLEGHGNSTDGFDIFISKLSPSGNLIWARATGSGSSDWVKDMKIDLNDNIILGGFFTGTMDMDPGPDTLLVTPSSSDAFLIKLDAAGDLLWAHNYGGDNSVEISALDVDELGDIYATGYTKTATDLDPGPGEIIVMATPAFASTAFIFKTDFLGKTQWAKQINGHGFGTALNVAKNGNVYFSGYFKNQVDVNPGPNPVVYNSLGLFDGFVVKLNLDWNFYGTVFNDINENGIRDNGEPTMNGLPVTAEPSGYVTTTNSNGEFHFYENILGNTVTPAVTWPNWHYLPAFVIADAGQTAMHFAAQGPQVYDAAIHAVEVSGFRPGFKTRVNIQVSNTGTSALSSVPVRLNLGTQASPFHPDFVQASEPPSLQLSDRLEWEITDLDIAASHTITVDLYTPFSIPIGTPFVLEAASLVINDSNPSNNTSTIYATVVGSFDPNDKQVTPTAIALQALDTTDLRYVIRFQNTGTYQADFVVIRDTLPAELDLSTLKVIASSHSNTVRLFGPHVLEFRFDPIHLPDSTSNEPESHGFVAFTVQAKHGLPLGTVVRNRAGIYFDYNEPVITNTSMMQVGTVVKTVEQDADEWLDFGLNPNPVAAFSRVKVDLPADITIGAKLAVIDAMGRVIQQISIPTGQKQVYLNGFPVGSYFVQLRSGSRIGGKVLIVE